MTSFCTPKRDSDMETTPSGIPPFPINSKRQICTKHREIITMACTTSPEVLCSPYPAHPVGLPYLAALASPAAHLPAHPSVFEHWAETETVQEACRLVVAYLEAGTVEGRGVDLAWVVACCPVAEGARLVEEVRQAAAEACRLVGPGNSEGVGLVKVVGMAFPGQRVLQGMGMAEGMAPVFAALNSDSHGPQQRRSLL